MKEGREEKEVEKIEYMPYRVLCQVLHYKLKRGGRVCRYDTMIMYELSIIELVGELNLTG